MIAALQAEYRKFVSTRIWWILLIVMTAYLALVSGAIAAAFSWARHADDMPYDGYETALTVYSTVSPLGYIFPVIIGTLSVTTEFRHHTLTGTLLAAPDRTRLVIAKLASCVPVGLACGLAATGAVVLASAPFLALIGDGAYLGETEVLKTLGFSVVVMALWTVIGVGFGCVIPNQIAAIIILIAFQQFIEPISRAAAAFVEQLGTIGQFFPGMAADAVVGSSFFSGMGGGEAEMLTRWQGVLVLLAYAAVFAVIGRLTTFRRDVD